jgi:hypothetical protein
VIRELNPTRDGRTIGRVDPVIGGLGGNTQAVWVLPQGNSLKGNNHG